MVYDGYIIRFIKDICTVYCWSLILSISFHGYFYDMMVTYIYAQLYVVKQIQVLRFLKMMSVKIFSMTSYCLELESWVL